MQPTMIDHKALVEDLNTVWAEGLDDAREPIWGEQMVQFDEELRRRRQGRFGITAHTVSHQVVDPIELQNQVTVFPIYLDNDENFSGDLPMTIHMQSRGDGDYWLQVTFHDPDEKIVHVLYGHKPILITSR
jgi:hypothetical protein